MIKSEQNWRQRLEVEDRKLQIEINNWEIRNWNQIYQEPKIQNYTSRVDDGKIKKLRLENLIINSAKSKGKTLPET